MMKVFIITKQKFCTFGKSQIRKVLERSLVASFLPVYIIIILEMLEEGNNDFECRFITYKNNDVMVKKTCTQIPSVQGREFYKM
jgi:hypothetical protein